MGEQLAHKEFAVMLAHIVACPTLVGRAPQLSGCRQLVQAAQRGQGQIALSSGEAVLASRASPTMADRP